MYGTPIAAYVVLLSIPLGLILFLLLPTRKASLVVLLGGSMFLPQLAGFDLPILTLNRNLAIVATLLLGVIIKGTPLQSGTATYNLAGVCILLAAFATAVTNPDGLAFATEFVPGLGLYDGLSMAVKQLVSILLPFYLGHVLFRRPEHLQPAFVALVIAALVYSIPVAWELRMSPQLHRVMYGYHQHSFVQVFRGGSWRPMVFMEHGLVLARFLMVGAVSAAVLSRLARSQRIPLGLTTTAVLTALLVLTKSVAAILYGLAALPLVLFTAPRTQILVAAGLVVLVLAYPYARAADLFPKEEILEAAAVVSSERAASLDFRFEHEERLLERFRERPVLGWGYWGRSLVRDEWTGEFRSVTDGFWVMLLGEYGVAGFALVFGMLYVPVIVGLRRLRYIQGRSEKRMVAGLCLIVALHGVDMLPNGFPTPLATFFSGMLVGVTSPRAVHAAGAGQAFDSGAPTSNASERRRVSV